MLGKKIFFFCTLILISQKSYGFFEFSNPFAETEKNNALAFLSSVELKKTILKKIETDLESLKQQYPEINKIRENRLATINKTIDSAKKKLLFVRTEAEQEYLHKKINFLNERKQNLALSQEIIQENEEILEKQIKTIKDFLDLNESTKKKTSKALYSWQELRDTQLLASEFSGKIETERKKKDDLTKQKNAEQETLASLQKRIEVKNKEQKKSISEAKGTDKNVRDRDFTLSNDLVDEEIDALKERVEFTELKIKKIDNDLILKEYEIDLLEEHAYAIKLELVVMEKRLALSLNDVETAKAEAALENQKAARIKDLLTKKIELKKNDKEKLILERNIVQKNIKDLESTNKKTLVNYHVLQSELNKINNHLALLDREIDLLYAKNYLAAIPVLNKELVYAMVNSRYQINNDKDDLNESIATFKNQKDLAQNNLKRLKDKREEVLLNLVENSREIEETKVKEVKILQRKESVFRNNEESVTRVLGNLEIAKRLLAERLVFNQEYLAINSELMASNEKIISQYDLIIGHLETKKVSQGLWKRSHHAISLKELSQSLLEAESFFKQLFWDTPSYLTPDSLLKSFKENIGYNLLMILLCCLFFLFFFLSTKQLLQFTIRRLRKRRSNRNESMLSLYTILSASFLEFFLEYRKLLIPWLFFYLHIACSFKWIFFTLKPFANPYLIAMFYLSGTPLFLYLSTQLLVRLKELNKRLSFLFFAEKFQDRFLVLVSSFCYTSAIFIPIRSAFLIYNGNNNHGTFPNVLIAAYSLTLAMVLLLFFSKDDVQKLIPSRPPFFAFVKKQIHLYYYPVFFFLMGLLILSNPYVGYSNLAWFLAFAVPLSVAMLYATFILHHYVRKYAFFLFMKEDAEEISDRFEYAKTYYGFFVIFSFMLIFFSFFTLIARIWGFNYMPSDIWDLLSKHWVLHIGPGQYFGFVQLLTLAAFIMCGYLTSSLFYRFVLNKLFDILRIEPGSQNTISKIFHYVVVSLSILLGFMSIHLAQAIFYIGTLLAVGLGLALKDILTDYVYGFFILIERPIEIGNYIRIDNNPEYQGTVHKIDARTTTIMTRLNHSLIISNKELMEKPIANWGKGRFAVGFEVHIIVDYRSNIDEIKKTILDVIQSNPVILRVPNIIIRLDDFEESALHFLCRAFISSRRVQEQWTIAGQIREEIFKAFIAKDIKFGFPQRILHLDGFGSQTKGPISITFDQP